MSATGRGFAGFAGLLALSTGLSLLVWSGRGRIDGPLAAATPAPPQVDAGRTQPSRRVRPPTVAGSFYPGTPEDLAREVDRLLASRPRIGLPGARIVLVPHAGYVYSAAVAAASFRELDPDFDEVFLLAANHNGKADFAGVSLPAFTHYGIPGAAIPLSPTLEDLREDPRFVSVPEAHTMHMIEVELPFLHALRGRPREPDFTVAPMILGRMDDEDIAHLAEILAAHAGPRTRFVFSVDLSHYHTDEEARRLDDFTIQAILSGDDEALARAVTDGDRVLRTMLALARRLGLEPTFLDARNSGDASGDRSRVVGYAAIAFHDPFTLGEEDGKELLAFARRVLEARLRDERTIAPDESWLDAHPILRIPRGAFVTLRRRDEKASLRGCIGDLVSRRPLVLGVRDRAIAAALTDPRFPPVDASELPGLRISISVLSYPTRVRVDDPSRYPDVLRPGEDGVVLLHEGRQSTYLPSVWRDLPDPVEFLRRLCLKQGSPPDAWSQPGTVLYRYGAFEVSEGDPVSPASPVPPAPPRSPR